MALSVRHGAMKSHADVPSAHYCAERALSGSVGVASVSGWAAAVRLKTTARIGRSSGFGCSGGPEAAAVSSTTACCRMPLMMSASCRSSSRHEALRSRQSDVVVEEESEEELASFWDRLHQAWRVLIGAPTEVLPAQATKKRFSRLLVRDRGFNSANLSWMYKVAEGAIKEHVELEGDEDTEVMAVVDRLGELRLDFRVKRVKSVLMEEPFAHSLDDIFSHSLLPNLEPSLFNSRDQLLEDSRDTHDSGVRLGGSLEEPFPSYVLPGVDPNFSVSEDQCEDDWASQGLEVSAGAAQNLKSITVVGALDEPVPKPVLSTAEPSLSITGDQFWDDSVTTQDLADHVRGASNLESTAGGAGVELFSSSVLLDVEPSLSISGGEREDTKTRQGLDVDVGGASNLEPTTEIDAEGVWYTFSFMDDKVEQGTGRAQVNGDSDKQL